MKKKAFSMLMVCLMLCSLLVTPASAATNYFSGGTGTLNTMRGTPSKLDPVSSGSVPDGAKVTDVEVSVTVSRGSIPFYLVVKSPDGDYAEKYVSASGRVTFTDFKDKNPKGTWYIYIYNTGTVFTDVSTATARMTVTYAYTGY